MGSNARMMAALLSKPRKVFQITFENINDVFFNINSITEWNQYFFNYASVESVAISGNTATFEGGLESVTNLSIQNIRLASIDVSALLNLTSLSLLDSRTPAINIKELTNISVLNLVGCNITSIDLPKVNNGANLNISYCQLTNQAIDSIMGQIITSGATNGQLDIRVNPGLPVSSQANSDWNFLWDNRGWRGYIS